MNDTNYKSIDFGALTRAGEGLTQWRALAMGFLTALVCCALFWIAQFVAVKMGSIVGVLLMVVVLLAWVTSTLAMV